MTALPYLRDKPALAATAIKLLANREQGDPRAVEAGDMPEAVAADRARRGRALADQWKAIIRREPIPDAGASYPELLADLREISAGASAFASRSPGTRVALNALREETLADWKAWGLKWPEAELPAAGFNVSAQTLAQLVEALVWHQQPSLGGEVPMVVAVHEVNLILWKRRAA